MKPSPQIDQLAAALSSAQGMFTAAEREHVANVVSKKGEGSSYKYNYADLAAYLDVCREPLSKNGLSFVQSVSVEDSKATITTLLLHASGQSIEFDPLTLVADNLMPQSIGSAITYARRYAISAAIGMASEADDDGNAAQGNQAETGRRPELPACPKCASNKSVIVGKPEYGGGFVCYGKKGGCGHKWQAAESPPAEEPFGAPPSDAKAKADAIAKEHGMTTADQLPLSKDPTGAFGFVERFDQFLMQAADAEKKDKLRLWLLRNKDNFEKLFEPLEKWYGRVIDATLPEDHERWEEIAKFFEEDKVYLQNEHQARIGVRMDKRMAKAGAA